MVNKYKQSFVTGQIKKIRSSPFQPYYWALNIIRMYVFWPPNKINKNVLQGRDVTLETVKAGLHCSFKMSRQMLPLLLIFGWKTFVLNATCKAHMKLVRYLQKILQRFFQQSHFNKWNNAFGRTKNSYSRSMCTEHHEVDVRVWIWCPHPA